VKLLDVVVQILSKSKDPLSRKELCDAVMATGKWPSSGKTPCGTISAALYRDIHSGHSRFVKDGKGKFKLSGVTPTPSIAKKKTQTENVIEALESCGGYATFSELNQKVDTSTWKTKTPAASIRNIVQTHPKAFYRIMPGQWGLVSMRKQIEASGASDKSATYTHAYYQGLLVEIGNVDQFKTYVPPQDKNRLYSHKKLSDIVTLPTIYEFTNQKILRKAKTVDTIWFNSREMPNAFFEVEHTTDIQNSLDKFFELQDFNAKFRIVSAAKNRARFDDLLSYSRYDSIRKLVDFYDYERLIRLHDLKMAALEVAM